LTLETRWTMPGSQPQNQNPVYRNDGRRSPDIYKLNGECGGSERKVYGEEEDRMLLRLFNDQDTPHPQPHPQPSHAAQQQHHGVKPEAAAGGQQQPHFPWLESMGGAGAGYTAATGHLHQHTNTYSSNPYLGGPNITPHYNQLTGGLMETERDRAAREARDREQQDSSSGSESESSHGSYHPGEAGHLAREGHLSGGSCRAAGIRMNKDEKLAREAGIKLNIKQDIVDPPMDEFNDMLSKEDLTEEQLNICRDIRRRGKNKVAAQNCRKRKLEQIDELQKKVDEAKRRQSQLVHDHNRLLEVYSGKVSSYSQLTESILAHHNKSPQFYTVLVQGEDVRIIAKTQVPEEQRFPKSPESLRYRHPPPAAAEGLDVYGGNLVYNQNSHHPAPFIDRSWD